MKGIGDVLGSVKDPMPLRKKAKNIVNRIGPGESTYTSYDRQIADPRVRMAADRGRQSRGRAVDAVRLVRGASPALVRSAGVLRSLRGHRAADAQAAHGSEQDHPWLAARRASHAVDPFFTDDTRRIAIRSYYSLVSWLDSNVGRVLAALDAARLAGSTRVIYTSDHGEDLGGRALWGKGTLTEESSGIPLIVSGPDVPRGKRVAAPASLLDVFPSVLDCCGVALQSEDQDLPGKSLFQMAAAPDDPQRPLLTQYHAAGADSGAFMLRRGKMKFLYYVGYPAQLYDLARDPGEMRDVSRDPAYRDTLKRMESELRGLVDPEAIDARAKSDQRAIVERNGGREAVVARGMFGYTPAPGETPEYQ